jgi:hypothetical protein
MHKYEELFDKPLPMKGGLYIKCHGCKQVYAQAFYASTHKSRYAAQCPKIMYRAAHNFTTQPILVRNAQSLCPTPSIGK